MDHSYEDMSVYAADMFPTLDFLCPNSNHNFQCFPSTSTFLGPSSTSFHHGGGLLDDEFQPSCSFTTTQNQLQRPSMHGRYVPPPYPSPPSTGPDSRRTLDLPTDMTFYPSCTNASLEAYGGILDSPLVHKHQTLKSQAPPSPPPTIPTATQELPPADSDFPCDLDDLDMGDDSQSDISSPSMSLSSCSSSPPPESPLSSCGLGDGHHLLSPLSPEWGPSYIKDMPIPQSSKDSVLLSGDHHQVHTFGLYRLPLSPPHIATFYPHQPTNGNVSSFDGSQPGFPFFSCSPWNSRRCTSQQAEEYKAAGLEDGALSPMSSMSSPLSSGDGSELDLAEDHSEPPDLDGSQQAFPFFNYSPWNSRHCTPEQAEAGLGDFALSPVSSFQHYPEPPFLAPLGSDLDLDLDLPPPSSPSVRSRSLPILEEEDDMTPPPSSPHSRLLSLPGADIDDTLIPDDFPLSSDQVESTFDADSSGKGLLLLELEADPDDVIPPRSPLPEEFVLDPKMIASISDADLQKLNGLRMRLEQKLNPSATGASSSAEATEFGLKKTQKKEKKDKESSALLKEVLALIRLKLGELGIVVDEDQPIGQQPSTSTPLIEPSPSEPTLVLDDVSIPTFSPSPTLSSSPPPPPENILTKSPKPPKPPKKKITSMDQLVARMVFRRHRSPRGGRVKVDNQKTKQYRTSPLARSSSSDESEDTDGNDEGSAFGQDGWGMQTDSLRRSLVQRIDGSDESHWNLSSSTPDESELEFDLGFYGVDNEPMDLADTTATMSGSTSSYSLETTLSSPGSSSSSCSSMEDEGGFQ
ncbi:hypothetical protein BDN72DRAFT_858265 [Pluteus cervinus]|uniref:Uncharacterized protein n=1 Tax=Pluteus cervinus TaxID=181527 RepID=A0ACD3AUJ1_9AGAR|nr:hypothetical protein BDN72DRAFT_858265 [Pluteus cervinus]